MKLSRFVNAATIYVSMALARVAYGQTFERIFDFPHVQNAPVETMIRGSDGNFYGTTADGGFNGNGVVFRLTTAGVLSIVHSFRLSDSNEGSHPFAGLLESGAGIFYGLTRDGGANGNGTAFKVTSAGEFTTLHHFTSLTGQNPERGLAAGGDGNFYGVTPEGGTTDSGVIFRLTPQGQVTVLRNFTSSTGPWMPSARLLRGNDGALYGTTNVGSAIFRVTTAGAYSVIKTLNINEGILLQAGLALGNDGNFYGAAAAGGTNNVGTIFKVTPAGVLTVLHHFNNANGNYPVATLALGSDGFFYGTTSYGGASSFGTLFRITSGGTHALLRSFTSFEGAEPISGLVRSGPLYGVAGNRLDRKVFYTLTNLGVFTVLAPFDDLNQGASPRNGLLLASDGNYYGSTDEDGGVIFRLTPSGVYSVLHRFDGTNGGGPEGALIQGRDGNLYGITRAVNSNTGGTFFRLTLSGQHTVLYRFPSYGTITYSGGLVEGNDGNFYGVFQLDTGYDYGSIYRVTPAGELSTVHPFIDPEVPTKGGSPAGPLLKLSDGNFIGTTTTGGGGSGDGTIFRMTPGGAITVIARLPHAARRIRGGLILGQDGNYYGTAGLTGETDTGAFIRCTPGGLLSIVAMFGGVNGEAPLSAPILAQDGNFYGTTSRLGSTAGGVIYKMTPSGTETVLRSLSPIDGSTPTAPLIRGTGGDLLGSTSLAGPGGGGTLFRVVLNRPPVARVATLGAVSDSTVQLSTAKLLTYASDPEGDIFSIIAVSATSAVGGNVVLNDGVITYTPLAGYNGADSFTYTLRDSSGATATGVVNVQVAASHAPSLNVISITPTASGVLVRFAGIPGALYLIEFRNALTDPWQTLNPPGPIQAGTGGFFDFEDTVSPRPPTRFYRAKAAQ